MEDTKQRLSTVMEGIGEITDLLYQQKSHEAFARLADLLASMSELATELFTLKQNNAIKDFDEQMLLDTLVQAMNALEAKDEVMLADVLSYDLADQLNNIMNQL